MKMKLTTVILAVLIGACAQKPEGATTGPGEVNLEPFSMEYPQWQDKRSSDRLNVVSRIRSDRQCYFDLNVAPAPLEEYEKIVRDYMKKQGAKILSEEPLSYEFHISDPELTFLAKTRGLYCGDKTFLATITCAKENYDDATAIHIIDSMQCMDNTTGKLDRMKMDGARAIGELDQAMLDDAGATGRPYHGKPDGVGAKNRAKPDGAGRTRLSKSKLGIIASPKQEFNQQNVKEAFNLIKQSGAQLTRHYVAWTDIENKKGKRKWKGTDYMIGLVRDSGLRLSVAFHTIRTAIRGPLPIDLEFRGWEDPELIERFSDFVSAFLERYADVVDYVEIGSEVNAYFARHEQEIEPYRIFFQAVHKNIKEKYPLISFGIVFAYRELKVSNDFSIYRRLSVGDHDGFTLYLFDEGFAHTRDPREVFESLEEIAELTGNRRFALEEVGWSPWPGLKGSDVDQQAAVRYFFDYLDQAPDRLEFMSWFNLHDSRIEDCTKIAKTFTKRGDAMRGNKQAMQLFADFLCHFGLRTNDGPARPAWNEWVKRSKAYSVR